MYMMIMLDAAQNQMLFINPFLSMICFLSCSLFLSLADSHSMYMLFHSILTHPMFINNMCLIYAHLNSILTSVLTYL